MPWATLQAKYDQSKNTLLETLAKLTASYETGDDTEHDVGLLRLQRFVRVVWSARNA